MAADRIEIPLMGDITRLLAEFRSGRRRAFDELFPILYEQLHSLAHRVHRGQASDTLSTTALVHEAYLKLSSSCALSCEDRRHFFAVAARAMRQIILDHSLSNLAVALDGWGRLEEAQSYHQQALEIRRKVLGPDNPDTIINLNGLAVCAYRRGDFETAAAAMRDVASRWRKSLGDKAPATVTAINNLGAILTELAQYPEAESSLRTALALRRETLGVTHPDVGQSLRNLGVLLLRERRYREAEAVLREALAVYEGKLAPDSTRYADAFVALSAVLLATDRPAKGEEVLRRAFDIRRARFGDAHPDTAEARGFLGACLSALGRTDEGEPPILSGYQTLAASRAHVRKAKLLASEVQRLYRIHGDASRALALLGSQNSTRQP